MDKVVSVSSSLRYFLMRFAWGFVSLLMPRKRPFEVLFGRVRYCQTLFENEMNAENCASNWWQVYNIVNSHTMLSIESLYGSYHVLEIIVEVNKIGDAGKAIYDRKDEKLSRSELDNLVQYCWKSMKLELSRFLLNEDESVARGAKRYCEYLRARKYKYENRGLQHFPVFFL